MDASRVIQPTDELDRRTILSAVRRVLRSASSPSCPDPNAIGDANAVASIGRLANSWYMRLVRIAVVRLSRNPEAGPWSWSGQDGDVRVQAHPLGDPALVVVAADMDLSLRPATNSDGLILVPEAERRLLEQSIDSANSKMAKLLSNSGCAPTANGMTWNVTSMQFAFDLWSYDDVAAHADAILARVRADTMPCDGAWPKEQGDAIQGWIDAGKPR